MNYFHVKSIIIVAGMLFILGVSDGMSSDRIPVFVSIIPQKYFLQKIGGDLVDISVLIDTGADVHTYEPKPKQMAALAQAQLYFAIGIEFESVVLKKVADMNPKMVIVSTDAGIEKIPMKSSHDHFPDVNKKEHHHGIKDPHIWLSPRMVMIQAQNILNALIKIDAVHKPVYEANFNQFMAELSELDSELKGILSETGKHNEFMVFHPSWGYFAQAYGLEQIPIEIEGKDPKPSELQQMIQHAKERGIRVIFVQPQFSSKNAEVIAKAIGGQVVFADPLALDWADNLRHTAQKFKTVLK